MRTSRYSRSTLWLATLALASCHADLRTREGSPLPAVLTESFDDAGRDGFFQHWLADVPASTRSMFESSAGRHGSGLRVKAGQSPDSSLRLSRTLDASALRGRRVCFSLWTKAAALAPGNGDLGLALARSSFPSAWDHTESRILAHDEWSRTAAVIDVPGDALSLELSITIHGSVDLTIDDLRVDSEPLSPSTMQPLTAAQRANLRSLILTLGYLRFFYPGDVAATADWQNIEIDAVGRILPLEDPEAVKAELTRLVQQIAPDAALYSGRSPPEIRLEPPRDGVQLTRWIHDGFGTGSPYASFRTGIDEPSAAGLHITVRKSLAEIGACKRATAQAVVLDQEGQLAVQVEVVPLVGRNRTGATAVVESPLSSASADISDDAHGVAFGVFVHGSGSVDIERVVLRCDGRLAAELKPDSTYATSGQTRYLYTLVREHDCGSKTCLRVERPRETAPQASDIVDVDIGNGLKLRMPLVAWTDGTRTLPPQPRFDPEVRVPASDRQARLAAVLDLWTVLRWFYPSFEDQQTDWDAELDPALQEAATATTSDAQRHALSRLTLALHDDHARVLRSGIDDGLLPVLFRSLENRIIVAATSPAGSSIPIGSTLVMIDGVPAEEARRRASELMSAATAGFALRHSTYGIAFGKKGTSARLTIREPGSTRDTVQIVPRLDRGELVPKLREVRPATGSVLADRVAYVDLHTLDDATWTSILPRLSDARAIIFDLRGYVSSASFVPLEYIADRELRSPTWVHPLVTASGPGRHEDQHWYIVPHRQRLHAKAIFLVDARTASAAETILQIVRGEHLGTIIGEPSGGTNGNTVEYDLIGEMSVRFTAMRVLNHDGSSFNGRGIMPDITVHPTIKEIIAHRDEVLEAAVEFAKQ
jgi:hypothetical protein